MSLHLNKELLEALTNEQFDAAKALIAGGADVNAYDDFWEQTALQLAILNNCDLDFAKYMISKGADPHNIPPPNGWTALFCATVMKNVEIVKYLLSLGVNPNATIILKDDINETPLDWIWTHQQFYENITKEELEMLDELEKLLIAAGGKTVSELPEWKEVFDE